MSGSSPVHLRGIIHCQTLAALSQHGDLCAFKFNMVSPLVEMFSPSPCPTHYGGHLATMTSADFCLITQKITSLSAISLVYQWLVIRVFHCWTSWFGQRRNQDQGLFIQWPHWISGYKPSILHVKQISPDKNIHFLCTAASFTVAVRSHGFVALCQLASSLRLI
jgi:hypothetical protein